MDEADVLCDRIAIVASGKLRAVGTQQRLKHRHGSGHRLTLNLDAPTSAHLEAAAARAHSFVIRRISASARLLSRVGTTLSYVILRSRDFDVANAFAALDAARSSRLDGIAEFGLQQSSLEEVFIKVVRTAEGEGGSVTVTRPQNATSTPVETVSVSVRNAMRPSETR